MWVYNDLTNNVEYYVKTPQGRTLVKLYDYSNRLLELFKI